MYYFEVLPLKNTGPESQTFTYEFEDNLKIGSIVQVPLRNRRVRGIVFEEVNRPRYNTRAVEKILSVEPVLNSNQIKLARTISDYYCVSLGETVNTFLPFDFGKKRRVVSNHKIPTKSSEKSLKLTPDQKKIYEEIEKAKPSSKHLIYGITGSGKTEVYLRLVANALKRGKGSIILVPEIALTPQTLGRFEARFPGKVAVWHSELKETEKFQTWNEVKSGNKSIVLGARSAIFLPVRDLEYIIIDEEHEGSYKQDKAPRYEAGKVAEWTSKFTGAKLVLGTATPRIETFYKSQNGEYQFYSMSKRIVQESLPPVSIIDMREEFKKKNGSIFSDSLTDAIAETLKDKKQVLLFVNRRGASTFVVCRDCGQVEKCPKCEVPLIYHPSEGEKLKCHHCEYEKDIPVVCPNCKSHAIKYFGLGTQRVEIEAKKAFPNAKIKRMDRDTTKKRGSHEAIFTDFRDQNYDILIGTQIITKGWDLPNVNLVGVIAADTTLNLPDFRSAERTFGLLTQVAGRTGRGYHPGKVIIQTYSPDNYAIRYAKSHDYLGFYSEEIENRKAYKYPPFSSLIKIMYKNKDEELIKIKATELASKLEKALENENIQILGPSPAFIAKKLGYYREQVIIKVIHKDEKKTDEKIIAIVKKIKPLLSRGFTIDVDPDNLL
ncbi:MAG: primosomal protein N' [Patescibacteria group bacterium]|nr:primosomal protein N' [Patescibacteria group bacterium]